MPNWVFNILDIKGDRAELDKLVAQVGAPHEVKYHKFEKTESGSDLVWAEEVLTNPVFSFWNIIKPDNLEAYYGNEKPEKVSDDIMVNIMHGFATGNDWYNWNTRNWGTKWDVANYPDDERTTMEWKREDWLCYQFNTAWSPPIEVLTELSTMYPSLEIILQYEEEQGWGGEICWENGEESYHNQYDIPSSHADYLELDKNCQCTGYKNLPDDPEQLEDILDWIFEDCPLYAQIQERLTSLQGTGATSS